MTPRKPTRAKQLGIDDAEYARLLEAQGGHCALCPNTPKSRRLHVDHDHATGQVRGLLCYVCNKYLPASRDADWHLRAAEYLEPVDVEPLTAGGRFALGVRSVDASKWRAAIEVAKVYP